MYGYSYNGKFHSFKDLNDCRKAVRMTILRSAKYEEFNIVRYSGRHKSNGYQSGDVLLGTAYMDAEGKNLARYQPVDSSISYPIKADGLLCRKGAYEVW